jgi:hypothetical protein
LRRGHETAQHGAATDGLEKMISARKHPPMVRMRVTTMASR